MRNVLYLIIISAMISWSFCQDITSSGESFAKVGTSGAHFLSISPDAKFAAMGNASVGYENHHASSVFYNPATLVYIEGWDFMFGNVQWFADIGFHAGAAAYKLNRRTAMGFHYRALSSGEMEETTVLKPEGTDRNFEWTDLAIGFSYASFLTDRFSFGANIYWVNENVDEFGYESSTWAVDLGTFYRTGFNSLKLGMSVHNFGSELDFDEKFDDYNGRGVTEKREPFRSYHMPLLFQVGISYDFLEDDPDQRLTVAFDGVHPNDTDERLNIGVEYSYHDLLILRSGVYSDHDSALAFGGIGLNLEQYLQRKVTLDYSLSNYGILDFVHQISVGYTL